MFVLDVISFGGLMRARTDGFAGSRDRYTRINQLMSVAVRGWIY